MGADKIKVSIDLNYYYENVDRPIIHPFVIEHFELNEGDIVIGFQDEQEWEGIIRYEPTYPEEKEWCLDISTAKEYSVSLDRLEGREEGGRARIPIGEIIGEIKMVRKMLEDGMDIDTVKKYTRLSRTRLVDINNGRIRARETSENESNRINIQGKK